MHHLSYRDVLSDIFDDKELIEFLVEFLDAHKNFGAFRLPRNLPSHVLVTLIDKVKLLKEQQLTYYPQATKAEEPDTFEDENGPEAPL